MQSTCIKTPPLVWVRQNCVGPCKLPKLLSRSLGSCVIAMLLVRVYTQRLSPVCSPQTRRRFTRASECFIECTGTASDMPAQHRSCSSFLMAMQQQRY